MPSEDAVGTATAPVVPGPGAGPARHRPRVELRSLPGLTAGVIALVVVLAAPALLPGFKLDYLETAISFAVAALSLNLLVGQTGQLSIAHAAFLGVGSVVAVELGSRGLAWPLVFLGAMLATAVAVAVVGVPSLRIRGLQVAIGTLVFQAFAIDLANSTGVLAATRSFNRPGYLQSSGHIYYLSLAVLALVAFLLRRTRTTRAGRSFVAVRDVEARAAAFGINAGRTKLLAYALSGALVGLGGALFAFQQNSLGSAVPFGLQPSLLLIAVVVVGGARSSAGIVIASFFIYALPSLAPSGLSKYIQVVFALFLILAVLFQPEGIGGVLKDLDRRLGDLVAGERERPNPRPMPTDPVEKAHSATALRQVPRPLAGRLPVPALLSARDVTVQYGGVQALQQLNLEVRRGEIVGLIGANGAGKSTFFNAVSGLAPVRGSIRYRDRELTTAPPAGRSGAGLVRTFQDMGLVRADTVRENLLLSQGWLARYPAAAGILGLAGTLPTEKELRRRADMALDLFGLDHLAEERLGDLPYGTMRIVEIAAAVAAGPDMLLLDEASAGLTPEEANQLGYRFNALRDELSLTLVIIEHHVPLIARVCDYCYCLESGRLIAEGTPAEVVAEPDVIESFLGAGSLKPARGSA
ncbi:MAG: branched-chain amino acid ABC transporter ATP-binding protein/permease [Acidimicrobiales bacterium]